MVLGFGFTEQAQEKGALPAPLFRTQDLGHGRIKILAEIGYAANFAPLEQADAGSGHVDPVFDADDVVRRVPMVKLYRGGYYPALSLAIARVVLEAKAVTPRFGPDDALEALDVGGLVIPVAEDGTVHDMPFAVPRKCSLIAAPLDVLAGTAPVDFTGAVVLVGTTAKGLQDLRPTPLAPDFPGVEIHANLISGMLNGDFKSVPPNANAVEALIMGAAGLLFVFAIPYRRPLINALGIALVIAIVVGSNLWLWTKHNDAIPRRDAQHARGLVRLEHAAGSCARSERFAVSEMFGEYVPPNVEQWSKAASAA